LRDFTFNAKYFSTIESATIQDGRSADSVSAIRETKWKTGESQQHRLIELSDQHYRLAYELVGAEPQAENLATITTITLHRVTETNATLVEWAADFSADISGEALTFHHASFIENLKELRTNLLKA